MIVVVWILVLSAHLGDQTPAVIDQHNYPDALSCSRVRDATKSDAYCVQTKIIVPKS